MSQGKYLCLEKARKAKELDILGVCVNRIDTEISRKW